MSGLLVVALSIGLWGTRALSGKVLADTIEAPSALSATPLSSTSVAIDWRGSKGTDSYVVKIGSDRALTPSTTKDITAVGTRLTIDLVPSTPGIDQFYRVDAKHNGKVTSSRTGRFTLKPGAVGKVSVDRISADGVKITWKKVANSRQFDIDIARDKGFTKKLASVRTLKGANTFTTKGLTSATTYWIRVRPINADQTGAFSKPATFKTMVRQSTFRVGVWNVCSEKCSGYAGRARIMAAFLNANKIDMFGLQEAGGQRVGRTTNAIFSGGTQGFRRADGGAEARYIFYRPALFKQLSGSYFAVGDGRHATWAKFEVKKTKRVFYFVDVHLENGKSSGSDAKRSREMNVMLSRMAAINDTGKPMIYGGDFNSGRHRRQDSPGVKMRGAGFTDSLDLAKSRINSRISTSHTFSTRVLTASAHVDHIFVSKEFGVPEWNQIVRLSGSRYTSPVVSDHNALSAVVALDSITKSVGKPTQTTTVDEFSKSLP